MAIIKAISSKSGIDQAIRYVTKKEKTEQKLLSGINCEPASAIDEMMVTKQVWHKTGGRTYKHFIQSFHEDEQVTPEQAHQIAMELANRISAWNGFEVLIATHIDKAHIHSHFIINSVSIEDGHKLQWSKHDLQKMKDISDELCQENELSICEKGKTFEGEDREETSAYTKETYQLLKKAEKGEVKSYVWDIANAVLEERRQATDREDFIKRMTKRGYGVDWQDSHKYITYTDIARQKQGEKQCKIRNNKLEKYFNIDFGKEAMENGFEVNREREQLEAEFRKYADQTAESDAKGTKYRTENKKPEDRSADRRQSKERKTTPRI